MGPDLGVLSATRPAGNTPGTTGAARRPLRLLVSAHPATARATGPPTSARPRGSRFAYRIGCAAMARTASA